MGAVGWAEEVVAAKEGQPARGEELCEKHFAPTDFVRTATYTGAQTGKVIEVPLERVRLKETAVPSVLANCPKYMSHPTPSAREAPEEKKARLEAASLRTAIELSVAAQEEENRKNKVGSFVEFCRALSNFSVSDFWTVIIKESKVVFLDLALHRAPTVRSLVTVSANLCIDVFIGEARIENLPSVNVPSHLQDLRQLNEVLQSVEQLHVSHSSDDNQKAHRLLKIVLTLLEDLCSEYQLQEFHGWHLEVLKFAILLAKERGNSSAVRHLGVTESTVRGWRKCRDRIFQAAPTRKAFCGPKTGRFPKIEEDLAEFVRQRRGQFLPLNAELVQIKARELAREAGVPRDTFKASRSWVQKFMRRAGFSLRRRTSICQKLPPE
ncbi:hypothetical protein MTO96_020023 [Rhipicephalus appendiculatus]